MASSVNRSASTDSSGWEPPSVERLQELLPQYEITALIGRGGMGAVYKGVQTTLGRAVAIKLLPESLQEDAGDASFAERFKLEARSMASLDHPAIISVHDFGETSEGHLYFVMEFIDGMDLQQYLNVSGGKLEPDAAVAIISHVLDALDYAHQKGIIHRDIKPANVLINSEGRVKIADFGLAKQMGGDVSGLTMSNVAMGTPDFIAPEAMLDSASSDGRADLYAVGVMLYQMLTGRLPRGMFKLPSEEDASFDPRFDDIIAEALEPNPEHRFSGAMDFRNKLDELRTQPVSRIEGRSTIERRGAKTQDVAPAIRGGLPPRPAARKSGGGMLWAVVVVAMLGTGGWLVWSGKKGGRSTPAEAPPADFWNASSPAVTSEEGEPGEQKHKQKLEPEPESAAPPGDSPAKPEAAVSEMAQTKHQPPPILPKPWPAEDPHFRQVGRFKFWHSEPNSTLLGSLDQLADIEHVKQVYMGGDVQEGSGVWVVLRQDGQIITSERPIEWGRQNIARICPGLGKFYGLIDREGRFEAFVPDVDKFPDREPPPALSLKARDAILGPDGNFLLTPDGGIHVWGKSFDGAERPPKDLDWSERPVPPAGRRFIAISHADGIPSSGAKVACQMEDQTLRLWTKSGPVGLPPEVAALKFRQLEVTREYVHGIVGRDQPVMWKLGDPNFRSVPGLSKAKSLHAANGRHAVYYLTAEGRPHFVHDGPGIEGVLDPVLPYILGARSDLISIRVHWNGTARKRIAWVLWFDGEPSSEAALAMPSHAENGGILDQSPEFRTRIANYQKARHQQLADLTGKYRNALTAAKAGASRSGDDANEKAIQQATTRAASYAAEIEKLPASKTVDSLPTLPALDEATPDALKRLREIFDRETAKIETDLLVKLDQSLDMLQTSMLEVGDLEVVDALRAYRKQVIPASIAASRSAPTRLSSAESRLPTATKDKPFENSLGMKFVPVPITGGPTDGETVFFSVWETRIQDYLAFTAETGRAWTGPDFEQRDDHPVVNVTWDDAVAFCRWLTEREGKAGGLPDGWEFRLPSDHEWSCAAGLAESASATPAEKSAAHGGIYPWGSGPPQPKDFANYQGVDFDSFVNTAPVGRFAPNGYGLFDLWGNVAEWCDDWQDQPNKGSHVVRGCGWNHYGPYRTSAYRGPWSGSMPKEGKTHGIGFRVVLSPP